MAEASTNTVCLEKNKITRIIKIKNFSNARPGDKITDQDISHKCKFVKLLQLRVYPTGRGNSNKGYVSVMIRRLWIPEYPLSFSCVVNIIDESGKLRKPGSFAHVSRGERSVDDIGLEQYVSRFELINDTSGLLSNNTLTLQCEVKYTIESVKDPMAESLWNMVNLLCEMFPKEEGPKKEEKWTFLIQTNEGDTFPLNFEKGKRTLGSEVLKASRVIRAMLETPMKENIEKKVVLKDIDFRTLHNFLSYVDNGRLITSNVEDACNLYGMADKYDVENLKQDCSRYLARHLNSENVMEISVLADLHNDDALFRECSKCMRRNIRVENIKEIFNLATTHGDNELLTSVAEFVGKTRYELLENGQNDIVKWLNDRNKEIETTGVGIVYEDTEPESLDSLEARISGQYEFYRL